MNRDRAACPYCGEIRNAMVRIEKDGKHTAVWLCECLPGSGVRDRPLSATRKMLIENKLRKLLRQAHNATEQWEINMKHEIENM